jgi:hypothetical protein
MGTKRRRRRQGEILSREVRIEAQASRMRFHPDDPGDPISSSGPYLELCGRAAEPVGDVREFMICLHLDKSMGAPAAVPRSVGTILQAKPLVQAVIAAPSAFFDRTWILAAAGRLRYCNLTFDRPRHGKASVLSASFSDESEEEYEARYSQWFPGPAGELVKPDRSMPES